MLYRPSDGALIAKVGSAEAWVTRGGRKMLISSSGGTIKITVAPELRICRPVVGLHWPSFFVGLSLPALYILYQMFGR